MGGGGNGAAGAVSGGMDAVWAALGKGGKGGMGGDGAGFIQGGWKCWACKSGPFPPNAGGCNECGKPKASVLGRDGSLAWDGFGTQLRSGGVWWVRGAARVRVREGRVALAPPLGAREWPVYRAEVARVGVCLAEEGVARVWLWVTGSTRRMGGGCWMMGAWGIGCPTGTPRSGLCGRRGVARVTGAMGGRRQWWKRRPPGN